MGLHHPYFPRNPENRNRMIRVALKSFLLLAILFAVSDTARADLVKLLSGGELRGKIVHAPDSKLKIRLETLTGATVVVDRDQTQFVTMRSLNVEEYETRLKHLDDNWEAHWNLAEWCRQHSLSKQRETHLIRVTELSPGHEKAQVALGRVWHQGAWIDRDELMASQGYVKYKNKYITPQELELIERTADELDRERSWYPKVKLWHGWLNGTNDDRVRKAIGELKAVDDPHAAAAIIKFMCADPQVKVRELAVSVLVKISGAKAVAGLVKLALFDDSDQIRDVALDGIGQDYYQNAQLIFAKELRSDYNTVVCRSATALGKIGDKRVVGNLIDALVTVHTYQVQSDQPANQTYSFTTDGNFASNLQSLPPNVMAAVRTGQMMPPIIAPSNDPTPKKMIAVRVEHYNAEVLSALEKLTQQNFGYDKRTWNLWWAAEKNSGKSTK